MGTEESGGSVGLPPDSLLFVKHNKDCGHFQGVPADTQDVPVYQNDYRRTSGMDKFVCLSDTSYQALKMPGSMLADYVSGKTVQFVNITAKLRCDKGPCQGHRFFVLPYGEQRGGCSISISIDYDIALPDHIRHSLEIVLAVCAAAPCDFTEYVGNSSVSVKVVMIAARAGKIVEEMNAVPLVTGYLCGIEKDIAEGIVFFN